MNSRQIQSSDVTTALGFTPLSTINGLDSSTTNVTVPGKPTASLAAALAALNTAIANGASSQEVTELAATVATLSGRVDTNTQAIEALEGQSGVKVTNGTTEFDNVSELNFAGSTLTSPSTGSVVVTTPSSGGGGGGTRYFRFAQGTYVERNFKPGATTTDVPGGPLIFKTTTQFVDNVCGIDVALPATSNWSAALRIRSFSAAVDYVYTGVYLLDDVGGYMKLFGFGSSGFKLALQNFINNSTYDAANGQPWVFPCPLGFGFYDFKITDDGTNLSYFISADGLDVDNTHKVYAHLYSGPRTFGGIATRIGFGANIHENASNQPSPTYAETMISLEQSLLIAN